jgi:hypothetical protein
MYTSTDTNGQPEADVTTIIVPSFPAATTPRPLVAYDVAWDSLSLNCAPSYEMQNGSEKEQGLINSALSNGWAVDVSDFEGLQAQYAGGVQAGHGVLDSVRAAERFAPAGLAGVATPVGIWGYSGGGQASAWAAELQPSYAPELHVKGVAEGGVPANVGAVARNIDGGPFSGIYLAAGIGLGRVYPQLIDLDSLLNSAGKAMEANISQQCIEQYVPQYAFQRIEQYTNGGVDPLTLSGVQQAIADDALGQYTPAGPLYVYHAYNDEIIPIGGVNALVSKYCSEHVTTDYYVSYTDDHNSLAGSGAPAAVAYLANRFAGQPPPSNC